MQRVLKLENALLEKSLGEEPIDNSDIEKQDPTSATTPA